MNKELQDISSQIQESGLPDAQKTELLNRLKRVDRELYTQQFKADTLNGVKETLTIMLEESVSELEKKSRDLQETLKLVEVEKKKSDKLLLDILPQEIANELKQYGKSYARKYDEVSVLFADIKDFSSVAEKLQPDELVTSLDEYFRGFDHLVDKYGAEKIKTIGDCYMCVTGLFSKQGDTAEVAVRLALDMLTFVESFGLSRRIQDLPEFSFRIGIHTGPVVAGVTGIKKFAYDIWGDTVNLAARMEQHGEAGKVNISASAYEKVKHLFACNRRENVILKNGREVAMYFVEQRL